MALANTVLQDTFPGMMTKINQAIASIQNTLTTGSTSTGNVTLIGTIFANTFVAANNISGGSNTAFANLNITSNTIFANTGLITQFNTNSVFFTNSVANVTISAIKTTINGNTFAVSANANFSNTVVFSNTINFTGQVNTTTLTTSGNTLLGANLYANNNIIDSPVVKNWKEAVLYIPNANGTVTLDLTYNVFRIDEVSNVTIAFTNLPANNVLENYVLWITHKAANTNTTFPAVGNTNWVKWDGGTIPPETTANNALDLWSLSTIDGTSFVGQLLNKNVS